MPRQAARLPRRRSLSAPMEMSPDREVAATSNHPPQPTLRISMRIRQRYPHSNRPKRTGSARFVWKVQGKAFASERQMSYRPWRREGQQLWLQTMDHAVA